MPWGIFYESKTVARHVRWIAPNSSQATRALNALAANQDLQDEINADNGRFSREYISDAVSALRGLGFKVP